MRCQSHFILLSHDITYFRAVQTMELMVKGVIKPPPPHKSFQLEKVRLVFVGKPTETPCQPARVVHNRDAAAAAQVLPAGEGAQLFEAFWISLPAFALCICEAAAATQVLSGSGSAANSSIIIHILSVGVSCDRDTVRASCTGELRAQANCGQHYPTIMLSPDDAPNCSILTHCLASKSRCMRRPLSTTRSVAATRCAVTRVYDLRHKF